MGGEGETSAKKSASNPPGRYFHETVFNLRCIRLKTCNKYFSFRLLSGYDGRSFINFIT